MADLACTYTLTTPGPDISFNVGQIGDGTDKYWLKNVHGLDGPKIRAPIDKVPMGNGTLIHTFWQSGLTPLFEGDILLETLSGAPQSADCQTALNVMEDNLRQALTSIVAANGTLAWTPTGLGARTLAVRHQGEPELTIVPIENFAVRQFTFSLISTAVLWS